MPKKKVKRGEVVIRQRVPRALPPQKYVFTLELVDGDVITDFNLPLTVRWHEVFGALEVLRLTAAKEWFSGEQNGESHHA